MSGWLFLISAGVMEIGFTSLLKLTNNFSRVLPTIAFILCAMGSFYMLTKASESIPL